MKYLTKVVSPGALYFISVAALLVVFFELWRFITMLMLSARTEGIPSGTLAQSFLVGLRFDFAIASYIVLPLVFFGLVPTFDVARSKTIRRINTWLLVALAGAAFFIHLVDIEFFRFFNSRINGMALAWSDSPQFVNAMIWESFHVVWYLVLFGAILGIFILLVRGLQKAILIAAQPASLVVSLISLPILIILFLVGMRGRIEEKAPLTWGQAYFSDHAFANLLALNPVFTFARDIFYDSGSKREVDRRVANLPTANPYYNTATLLGIPAEPTDTLSTRIVRRVQYDHSREDSPNVILILMESLSASGVGCLDSRFAYNLTPQLDSLAEHGVLFTRFYAAGMHTYAGILGALYGYPTVPGKSVMKQVTSQENMSGLPTILRNNGYHTMFFTTHDPHFDNMQGFLKSNGVQDVYSLFDFDESQKLSTLGVPDHVMFDEVIEHIHDDPRYPFFAAILTGSNHGPWLVPDVPYGALPDTVEDVKRLNAFKYADWALGRFVRMVFNDPMLENTVILVTGDHGLLIEPIYDLDLSLFHVPLLVLDPSGHAGEPRRSDRIGSQVDLVATVMDLLDVDYDNFTFGRSLLTTASESNSSSMAVFSEGYMIGLVQSNHYAIIRPEGNHSLYDFGDEKNDIATSNDAMVSHLANIGLSYLQTAYFNLQFPLHDAYSEHEPSQADSLNRSNDQDGAE